VKYDEKVLRTFWETESWVALWFFIVHHMWMTFIAFADDPETLL
jgi:hypothetical protein